VKTVNWDGYYCTELREYCRGRLYLQMVVDCIDGTKHCKINQRVECKAEAECYE